MSIIYVLIPLSLLLLGFALWAFFWAVRNDQFDDLDSPALDVLDDEYGPGGRPGADPAAGSTARSRDPSTDSSTNRSTSGGADR